MDAVPVLCLLGILCSLALTIDTTVPPEDIDGSGDDEDFSGSGSDGVFVDLESKDVTVFSSSISTLVPTVEGSTAAQEPEIVDKEGAEVEATTTTSSETTKTHEDIIEDLFGVDEEVTTHEATTPPSQQNSTASLVEENDTKKHHHHHHHPHHHNHTTTSSPSSTSESDGQDNGTEDTPLEGGEPIGFPEETTTSTPDIESELDDDTLVLTTSVVDLSKHEGTLEETTSGSTSTYPDNDDAHVEPFDADNLPELDSSVTTTVVSDSHTSPHPHHHHHPHHPHHPHTTSSVGEADVQPEVTTIPSEPIEPEDNVQEAEHTTPLADDEFPLHGHPHPKTTPSPTMPTEPEKPHEVHTHEPKGRRVHGPDVRSTTAIPVINEEEHIPEDSETDDSPSATAYYNVSRNPFDENEISDSKEEGPSGIDEDIFFEVTVPSINRMKDNEDPITDDGTSNASHGIMERKELLAGIIAGGVAGLVFAAFLVAFVLYRMKKKDEGSYSLEEPKQSNGGYQKPREQREFYA